ncbi:MAG: hypothetical protein COB02_11395 [Candidatus Cloacimonadota bacterium]|nr:MAG: hypothetical protein COB02_11395 [Candidatus Cloacimonadota bacterium]
MFGENDEDQSDFNTALYDEDFEDCSPSTLKMLFYLLNENKQLVQEKSKMLEENHSLSSQLSCLKNDLYKSCGENIFPSKKLFKSWILDKFIEIEQGLDFIERNYPKGGLCSNKKVYIDYLYQDVNDKFILVEVLFFSKGLKDDLMTYIARLEQASQHLSKTRAVATHKIRKMIISNFVDQSIMDACTLNQVELIYVKGIYDFQKIKIQ